MYGHMKLHAHAQHLPEKKQVYTCYTVIHCAGCVSVDAYQASSAALHGVDSEMETAISCMLSLG